MSLPIYKLTLLQIATLKFLSKLQRKQRELTYLRVDFVADCYFKIFNKAAKKIKRGSAVKIIVKSRKSEVTWDFLNFLSNGENRCTWLSCSFKQKRLHLLNAVRTQQMTFLHWCWLSALHILKCFAITKRQIPKLLLSQCKHFR